MLHAFLCLVPVLAMAVPLLRRRYPGERALTALRGGERRRSPRPVSVAVRPVFVQVIAHGARLMGCSLAVRPPPSPAAAS